MKKILGLLLISGISLQASGAGSAISLQPSGVGSARSVVSSGLDALVVVVSGEDDFPRVPSPELDVLAKIASAALVTGWFSRKNSEQSVLPAGLVVNAPFATPALQPQAVAQAVPAPQAQAAAYVGVQVPKGSFACGVCGKILSNSTKKEHLMMHNGVKPFACQSCSYVTSYRSALKGHMRTHTGEKPHNCLYCEKSFTQGSTLKNHIKTHTGVTPYACSVPNCDYRSSQKGNLQRHMLTHNN